jgi:hypothetical protein
MGKHWKKLQWAGIALTLVVGVLWQFFPLKDAGERLDSLPIAGVGFNSQNFEVTDQEREIFHDNRLLKRLVWLGGQQFYLSIIDGSKYRNAVHDPTLCFLGDGFTVERRKPIRVPGGYGEIIHLEKGEETQEIFVCFSDGEQRYSSVMRYWLQTTMRRLSLGASGEEPVRIIIQSIDKRPLKWRRLLMEFTPLWSV